MSRRTRRNNGEQKEGIVEKGVTDTEWFFSGLFKDVERFVVPVLSVILIVGLLGLIIYLISREVVELTENTNVDFYYSKNDTDSEPYLSALHEIASHFDSAKYGDDAFPLNIHDCSTETASLTGSCNNVTVPSLVWYRYPKQDPVVYDGNVETHAISVWMNSINSKVPVM